MTMRYFVLILIMQASVAFAFAAEPDNSTKVPGLTPDTLQKLEKNWILFGYQAPLKVKDVVEGAELPVYFDDMSDVRKVILEDDSFFLLSSKDEILGFCAAKPPKQTKPYPVTSECEENAWNLVTQIASTPDYKMPRPMRTQISKYPSAKGFSYFSGPYWMWDDNRCFESQKYGKIVALCSEISVMVSHDGKRVLFLKNQPLPETYREVVNCTGEEAITKAKKALGDASGEYKVNGPCLYSSTAFGKVDLSNSRNVPFMVWIVERISEKGNSTWACINAESSDVLQKLDLGQKP